MHGNRALPWFACGMMVVGLCVQGVSAQQRTAEDEAVDALRSQTSISGLDEGRIRAWVQLQANNFAASKDPAPVRFKALREVFQKQRVDPKNSPAFIDALAAQTAAVAQADVVKPDADPVVARGLMRVLLDLNRIPAVPGFVAGLQSTDAAARVLAAKGLLQHFSRIPENRSLLQSVIEGLRAAGLREGNALVLKEIYRALAYEGQVDAVFDVYMSLLDRRLELRRGPLGVCDGAEIPAAEFLRRVAGTLNADRQREVVRRVAVLLRCEVQRYTAPQLNFAEQDSLERLITVYEELLEVFVRQPGTLRTQLESGVRERLTAPAESAADPKKTEQREAARTAFLLELYKWIGNPTTKEPGLLNQSPWSVEIGAP
ncbi:MAG TPA: hypothetical protein PKK06_09795 [Phycisphaerae bacterium]|nr:hypothetical protein [Phycisphaerae bacterium]HNU45593.1 hypothetical protein [Phycisphaerae bacterium]